MFYLQTQWQLKLSGNIAVNTLRNSERGKDLQLSYGSDYIFSNFLYSTQNWLVAHGFEENISVPYIII